MVHSAPTDADAMPARSLRVSLGEKIFFDSRLSRDGNISCSTCHAPESAFADHRTRAVGIDKRVGTRNAPSLLTAGAHTALFWDGRRASLEEQVLDPFVTPEEMGLPNLAALMSRLDHSAYRDAFGAAYSAELPALSEMHVRQALAAYVRSLRSDMSPFDRYMGGAIHALSPSAQRGLYLFRETAGCADCHSMKGEPATFSDDLFHQSGIGMHVNEPLATLANRVAALPSTTDIGELVTRDPEVAQLGRFVVTRNPKDIGAFRTPSLRNVALTAPYMHDGSVASLQEAVDAEIYYRSLKDGKTINLTSSDRKDLIAFLSSLSTESSSRPKEEKERNTKHVDRSTVSEHSSK